MHVHVPDDSKTTTRTVENLTYRYIICKCGQIMNIIRTRKK